MSDEIISLMHPKGKNMPNINRAKYETIKKVMLSELRGGELTHKELFDKIRLEIERQILEKN